MANYDGEVRIKITTDDNEFNKKLDELNKRLEESSKKKIETDYYKDLQDEIAKTEKKLNALNDRMEKWQEMGKKTNSSAFKSMQYDAEQLENTLASLKGDLLDTEQNGNAYATDDNSDKAEKIKAQIAEMHRLKAIQDDATISDQNIVNLETQKLQLQQRLNDLKRAGISSGYEEYDKITSDLAKINSELNSYKGELTSTNEETKKLSINTGAIYQKIKGFANGAFSKITQPIKSAISHLKAFDKQASNSSSMVEKFGKRVAGLAKRVFIFSLITKAFRAMVDGIKTGIQEFAKHNDAFNQVMSDWSTATNQMKGQVGVAFAQLLSNIMPIITTIVNALSTAISYISQFIALLSGASSWKKATSQQVDYAASLDKTAGSADKAAKSLAKFDELNNTTTSSSSGGGGGAGSDISYEDVPFDEDFLKAADKVKKAFGDLFAPIKKAWNREGKFVMDSWKYALEEIQSLIKDIGADFLEVWNQEATVKIFEDIFHIIGDIGLTVGNLARQFHIAWNYNETGKKILEDIRDIIGIIVHHIREAADATVDWSAKLDFIPLMTSIEEFLKAIQPMIDGLSGIMLDFYTEVLLPLSKWTLEKGLPELFDILSEFVSSIDWEGLRNDFSEFWKVLEPFAETVGEGLLLFLKDILQVASDIINSGIIQNCLKALEEWMKDVSAEDIRNALWTLVGIIGGFKLAVMGFEAITTINSVFTTLTTFFGWFASNGTASATGIDTIAKSAGGLLMAVGSLAGAYAIVNMAKGAIWQGLTDIENAFNKEGDLYDNQDKVNQQYVDRKKEFYSGATGLARSYRDDISEIIQDVEGEFTNMPTYTDKFTYSSEVLGQVLDSIANGATYTNEQLTEMQEKYTLSSKTIDGTTGKFKDLSDQMALTNEDIDTIIQAMIDQNDKLDLAKLGLDGYNGSITEMRLQNQNSKESVDNITTSIEDSATAMSDWSSVAEESTNKVSEKLDSTATKASESGTNTGTEFANSMATSIGDNTESVAEASATLAESASQSMEENESAYNSGVSYVTAMCEGITASTELVTTALSEMILTMQTTFTESFSVEMWTPYFTNMITAFQAQWMLFLTQWTTNLVLWKANNILYYFGVPVWTLLWNNILLAYRPKWTEFSTEWKTNMDNWKLTMIDPFFTIELWTQYGDNMKTGIEGGFNGIVDSIGNVLNAIADMFNQLMENIKNSMNDMVDDFNEIAEQLGTDTIDHVHFSPVHSVSIPRLATGTVIPPGMSEFLAVLGDNNHDTEVVSPLTTMKQAMMEAINEMGGVGGSDGDIIVQCILDGKVVFEEVRKRNREYRKQTGSNAFA